MKPLGALFVPFVPGSLVSFLLLIAIVTADSVRAEDCVGTNPFVLGSVVELPEACPGGSGPIPNTTCRWIEVSCDGMMPVRAQVRITEPTPGAAERGTVLLGSGGNGASFYYEDAGVIGDLADRGFRVADRAWAAPDGWMTREVGLRRQACRYATLLSWLHDNVHRAGALVASGNSHGSAEIGYALTSWGMGSILDLAVPTSGPALARLDYVCPNPTPEWQALCLTIVPPGALDCPDGWECSLSNIEACYQCSSAPTPEDWRADSVAHAAAVFDYPTTRVHFLYGQYDCGRAVPGGLNWANSVTSEKAIEFVPNTPHDMVSPEGRAAILRAIDQGTLTCGSDPTTMCLNAGRFRVTADWRKPDGTSGHAQAVSLTPDSGYFWFFSPANIEAVVKVLNACSVNAHHWVFSAGLTNVEVTLRVVDTQSGSLKTYVNPLGTAYQPIQDTSAFATCP